MSIADSIAPHLPYLRRFARAISRSQKSGDAYIVELLESLVENLDQFPQDVSPRVAVYKLFLRLWNSVSVNDKATTTDDIPSRRLASITPKPRQAFLLTAVEGFSINDVATIIGVSDEEAQKLIEQAANEVSAQVATKVLIIEDEPLISKDLEKIMVSLGHSVVGKARTHNDAIAAVKAQKPGLILADIQLADGSSGLEAVNEILRSIDVPVIFITAFPERLLSGERPEPAFLLTKPFDRNALTAVVSQALFFDESVQAA